MKLHAEITGKKHEVEIRRDGGRLFARVDDRNYELEASEPEPNVFLFKRNGKVFEVIVSPQKNTGQPYAARVGTAELDITLTDPKRLRGSAGVDEQTSGRAEIKTAMPGKVVRILVSEGDSVNKGDGVIVVEAMKMQNEMRSPKDGTVSGIKVAENDTVSAGDVLMMID